MTSPQPAVSSWIGRPWVQWSWLVVVAFVVVQSISYHWRALPTSSAGYFARGRADFLDSDYERAAENFTRSIERNPKDPIAYIYRGESLALLGEYEKAFVDIDRSFELKPEFEKAYAAVGDVKALAWDAEGAREAYTKALGLDPDCTRCSMKRGLASYDTRRWDEAAADFRRAMRYLLADDLATAHFFLWLSRARAGDAPAATEELIAVMREGRIRGDRFWAGAQFLTGQITESAYLAALAKARRDDVDELQAEAFYLAAGKRLSLGDRAAALSLMRKTLATGASATEAYDSARAELEWLLVGFHPAWTARSGKGLEILAVAPGGPAEAAGVRPGLILTAIDGSAIDQESFIEFLATVEPGSTVELHMEDGAGAGVRLPLTVTPGSSGPTR